MISIFVWFLKTFSCAGVKFGPSSRQVALRPGKKIASNRYVIRHFFFHYPGRAYTFWTIFIHFFLLFQLPDRRCVSFFFSSTQRYFSLHSNPKQNVLKWLSRRSIRWWFSLHNYYSSTDSIPRPPTIAFRLFSLGSSSLSFQRKCTRNFRGIEREIVQPLQNNFIRIYYWANVYV